MTTRRRVVSGSEQEKLVAAQEDVLLKLWYAKMDQGIFDKAIFDQLLEVMDDRASLLGLYRSGPTETKH